MYTWLTSFSSCGSAISKKHTNVFLLHSRSYRVPPRLELVFLFFKSIEFLIAIICRWAMSMFQDGSVGTGSSAPLDLDARPAQQGVGSLLVLLSAVCFFSNGALPSIQSYSCLPYGRNSGLFQDNYCRFIKKRMDTIFTSVSEPEPKNYVIFGSDSRKFRIKGFFIIIDI